MNDLAAQFRELDAAVAKREIRGQQEMPRAGSNRVLAIRPRRKAPAASADTVVVAMRQLDREPTLDIHTAVTRNPLSSELETLDDDYFTLLSAF